MTTSVRRPVRSPHMQVYKRRKRLIKIKDSFVLTL
jgi:hypothetical protein